MALTVKGVELISTVIKNNQSGAIKKIVSFGYPIILAEPKKVEELFKVSLDDNDMLSTVYAQRVRKIHGKSNSFFVDPQKLFKKLGAILYTIDILDPYKCEIIADLNEELPLSIYTQCKEADLCIDPGTIEHVFYAGNAFVLLYTLCKRNGHILHMSAPIAPNHGLWNPQEKLFLKFYMANHAEIIVAEKYWKNESIKPFPFIGKRYPLTRASETRSTVFVRKTNHSLVIPKDY